VEKKKKSLVKMEENEDMFKAFYERLSKHELFSADVNFDTLVEMTNGFAQADLKALIDNSMINSVERIVMEYMVEQTVSPPGNAELERSIEEMKETEKMLKSENNVLDNDEVLESTLLRKLKVTGHDMTSALESIRIHQVGRERNSSDHRNRFVYFPDSA